MAYKGLGPRSEKPNSSHSLPNSNSVMPVAAKPAVKAATTKKSPLALGKSVSAVPAKRKNTESIGRDENEGEPKEKKIKGKGKVKFAEAADSVGNSEVLGVVGKKKNGKGVAGKKVESKTEEEKSATKKKLSSQKLKKVDTPSPESSEVEVAEEEVEAGKLGSEAEKEEEESESEEEVLLHGFSSESDSSDEEDDGVDSAPIDVAKLPTVAKDDTSVARKLERAKRKAVEDRGVIYLGRIPHGFYEDQMKAYFSQFGEVTRLRLSRNKKTGRSKHYAFIEMASSAVAEIVAETMDNYLLMGHILRCKLIPKEDVHPELWIGANRKFRRVPTNRLERLHQNKARSDEEKEKVTRRLLKRQEEKKRKLQAAGIDYDFGSAAYSK